MKILKISVGSRSILFGVHCFLVHPWFVALAWWRLYGFPWDPRLWVAFFVHDLGYWGKPNMDGSEGETHPELGGRIMGWLFDYNDAHDWCEFVGIPDPDYRKWELFTSSHSRYYAWSKFRNPSKLCAADKLSFCFEPYWLYVLRARMSGELKEYINSSGLINSNNASLSENSIAKLWYHKTKMHFLRWTAKNYRRL